MVWYCVEERNEPISKYGRYRRRFLDGSKFSIFSNLGKDRLVIRQVKNRSQDFCWCLVEKKICFQTTSFISF